MVVIVCNEGLTQSTFSVAPLWFVFVKITRAATASTTTGTL